MLILVYRVCKLMHLWSVLIKASVAFRRGTHRSMFNRVVPLTGFHLCAPQRNNKHCSARHELLFRLSFFTFFSCVCTLSEMERKAWKCGGQLHCITQFSPITLYMEAFPPSLFCMVIIFQPKGSCGQRQPLRQGPLH